MVFVITFPSYPIYKLSYNVFPVWAAVILDFRLPLGGSDVYRSDGFRKILFPFGIVSLSGLQAEHGSFNVRKNILFEADQELHI